jgi:hypothetical protein
MEDASPEMLSIFAGAIERPSPDFNGDGALDFKEGAGGRVFLGNGDGTFVSGTSVNFSRLLAADVNRDGRLDVVTTDGFILGNGNGSFQARQTFASGSGPTALAIGDFNADSWPDVVICNGTTGLSVLLNDGAWVSSPPVSALTIRDAVVTEGNSGAVEATLTVTLSSASAEVVTVNYSTSNKTAVAGSDYVAASGTLTFAPGQTTKTIIVSVNGDRHAELSETFVVNLSSPTNAILFNAQGNAHHPRRRASGQNR